MQQMERVKLPFLSPHLLILMIILLILKTSYALQNETCLSSCGDIQNIIHPFRLTTDPTNCGLSNFNLSCENNVTVLYLFSGKYYVKAINYKNNTIRLVDAGVDQHNCSSIPLYALNNYDFDAYYWYQPLVKTNLCWNKPFLKALVYINCEKRVNISSLSSFSRYLYVNPLSPCIKTRHYYYYYVMVVDEDFTISQLEESCHIEQMTYISTMGMKFDKYGKKAKVISYVDIHNQLVYGFQLQWGLRPSNWQIFCHRQKNFDWPLTVMLTKALVVNGWSLKNEGLKKNGTYNYFKLLTMPCVQAAIIFATKFVLCGPCVAAFLIYTWRRRHLSMYSGIEEFLQNHNNLTPIRYSYYEIKQMTKGFKEKLGEGGYGSVYKGKLRSGHLVAIKLLGKSKTNGQDFINEVATIGRIHHVNVVQLIGFCVQGSKRALVYEFMAKGSLDKYIFSKEENIEALDCKKMFEVAKCVAFGIEYLHEGCNMQILHFDIKPHNILLDDNFIPKISDFGLARLCPLDNSIVSLTVARGTIGYIAPELFYKNIGGVSYKVDVYSFGMLLMEMASRRKNLNAIAENSSQIYFPFWVYDQFNEGKEMVMNEEVTEEDSKVIKKMILVALWCIQLKPSDRPSMKRVIEMLEGEVDHQCLELPPKPSFYQSENPMENAEDILNSTWSSELSDNTSAEISMVEDIAK